MLILDTYYANSCTDALQNFVLKFSRITIYYYRPITKIINEENDSEVSIMDQMIAASNAARNRKADQKKKDINKGFGDGMSLSGTL